MHFIFEQKYQKLVLCAGVLFSVGYLPQTVIARVFFGSEWGHPKIRGIACVVALSHERHLLLMMILLSAIEIQLFYTLYHLTNFSHNTLKNVLLRILY